MLLVDKVNEYRNLNKPIKLHLGCGSVLLDDFINIDGEYMSGYPGITFHDLTTTYPIPDNSVDEILSVHVIEHFPRNLVEPILKEWLRILKPGGFVATEWPDMLKACKEIVNNPDIIYSSDRRELKRTMLVFFFDDSRYDDYTMMHKWGYSEESLGKLFISNGFSSWVSEPNKFPKTLNDSRVVAYK
jgi:predicted SAM-dependent methyltransferase